MLITPGHYNNVEKNNELNNIPDFLLKFEQEQENTIKNFLTDCYKELNLKSYIKCSLIQKIKDEKDQNNLCILTIVLDALNKNKDLINELMPEDISNEIASKQSKEIIDYLKKSSCNINDNVFNDIELNN